MEPWQASADGETPRDGKHPEKTYTSKGDFLMKIIHHEEMSIFEACSVSGNTARETDTSKLCLCCRGN